MKIVRARLKSVSPYSQSKAIGVEKHQGEGADDYERRTWAERIHCDADGQCFIPPMSFKKALDSATRYAGMKISGKGQATYTKHVESGTFIVDSMPLGIRKDQVPGEWLFLDANGKKGKASSGRVMRCMPKFDHWEGDLTIHVIDETVLQSIAVPGEKDKAPALLHFLNTAGSLIGVGRFRPENGGFYGRFVVVKGSFTVLDESGQEAVA